MPRISDKLAIKNPILDKRVKLLPKQKEEIRKRVQIHSERVRAGLIGEAISQRILAKEYGVSRTTIVWVLFPERLKENKERRKKRGGSKHYYDQLKPGEWAKTMKKHREYKQYLYKKGLL